MLRLIYELLQLGIGFILLRKADYMSGNELRTTNTQTGLTDEDECLHHDFMSSQRNVEELEKMINKMSIDDEAVLPEKIEETESNSRSRIEVLTAHSNNLQAQLDNASSPVNNIMDQVSFPHQEFQSSNNPNGESDTNENLKLELDILRIRISEMEKEKASTVSHQNEIIKRLTNENKELKQISEKKIQETVGELRKSLEDRIRMMSRRIKVAEELHTENKEVFKQTRDKYPKEKTDMRIIGDMMNELNRVEIKFEEFSMDIMNRVSTISCWAVFAKEWLRSKGMEEKEMVKVKEEEMMRLMEKMKEMEMVVKEKEEEIVVIGEEKREAIRQLCVWIDYHRSNS